MAGTVHDGNPLFANAPFDERIKLVEASFKTVLDADLHEDDKAGRILSAIAFLTTAAAVIFNVAHSSNASTSTPIFALSAYIFFVIVGSALYLGALGPSLNRPSKPKVGEVPSLLFFHFIAPLEKGEWSKYWQNGKSLKLLQDQMVQNYIDECLLVAQKVDAKFTLMSWGSIFFRVALLCFIILMTTLFLPDSGMFWVLLLFGLFGIFASYLFVNWKQPPEKKLNLSLQKLQLLAGQPATLQGDNQLAVLPTALQDNKKKVPWSTFLLITLTILSFIGFVVLLALRMIEHLT